MIITYVMNQYIVFSHGSIIKNNFLLSKYKIITFHIPGKIIKNNLVKIILDQIYKKKLLIIEIYNKISHNTLDKQHIFNDLENKFIIDWLLKRNKQILKHKLISDLANIGDPNAYDIEIKTKIQLKKYIQTIDFNIIKKYLGFKINIYKPNEPIPNLMLNFNFNKSLCNIKSGIFKISFFKNFDFDNYDEINAINYINTNNILNENNKSIVNFDNSKNYFFDLKDNNTNHESFFKTINPFIKSGFLLILSCGSYLY